MTKTAKILLAILVIAALGGVAIFTVKGETLTGFMKLNQINKSVNTPVKINSDNLRQVQKNNDPVNFSYVSSKATVINQEGKSDAGEFSITFKATAIGSDAHLSKQGISYAATGGNQPKSVMDLTSTTTDSEDTNDVYELDKGATRTFTVSVLVDPDMSGYYNVKLNGLKYGEVTGTENTYNADSNTYKTQNTMLKYVAQ